MSNLDSAKLPSLKEKILAKEEVVEVTKPSKRGSGRASLGTSKVKTHEKK